MGTLLLDVTGESANDASLARAGTRAVASVDAWVEHARNAGHCVALASMAGLNGAASDALAALRRHAPNAIACLVAESGVDAMERALSLAARAGARAILPAKGWQSPGEWKAWIDWARRPEKARFFDLYLGANVEVPTRWVHGDHERRRLERDWRAAVEAWGTESQSRFDARLILEELLNNALMHGLWNDAPEFRERLTGRFALAKHQWIEARFARCGNCLALSIADSGGRLDAATAIESLRRQFADEGLQATSGRGLFLAYQLSARMLTRMTPGRRTEISVLLLNGQEDASLMTNEPGKRPVLALEMPASSKARPSDPGAPPPEASPAKSPGKTASRPDSDA